MINELIIILTDKQQASLIKKSLAAGEDDDHAHLQQHISKWLSGDDEKRLSHKE